MGFLKRADTALRWRSFSIALTNGESKTLREVAREQRSNIRSCLGRRGDFLHKLSRFYVNNYDVICVEDLKTQNMVKNPNLAGKILDASWGKFLHMLAYKAENAGKLVLKVNPRAQAKNAIMENSIETTTLR